MGMTWYLSLLCDYILLLVYYIHMYTFFHPYIVQNYCLHIFIVTILYQIKSSCTINSGHENLKLELYKQCSFLQQVGLTFNTQTHNIAMADTTHHSPEWGGQWSKIAGSWPDSDCRRGTWQPPPGFSVQEQWQH